MRSTDEEMDHLASCLVIDSNGVSQLAEDTFKRMRRELLALRKVAEAARHFIDTMENFTKATHWLFEIDEALKEAGYDA